MPETWKDVVGYEGRYQVSSMGRIKSFPNKTRNGERILKNLLSGNVPYYYIDLVKDAKTHRKTIHRIVAEAFIPNPENKPQVNHIDGDKRNNRFDNLEWNTRSENQLHSIRTGLRTAKGVKNSQAKLDEVGVKVIREAIAAGYPRKEIAKYFNISQPTLCDIYKRRSWAHV